MANILKKRNRAIEAISAYKNSYERHTGSIDRSEHPYVKDTRTQEELDQDSQDRIDLFKQMKKDKKYGKDILPD